MIDRKYISGVSASWHIFRIEFNEKYRRGNRTRSNADFFPPEKWPNFVYSAIPGYKQLVGSYLPIVLIKRENIVRSGRGPLSFPPPSRPPPSCLLPHPPIPVTNQPSPSPLSPSRFSALQTWSIGSRHEEEYVTDEKVSYRKGGKNRLYAGKK